MATNPETRALLEMALHHVLAEQSKLLKHGHHQLLITPAQELGDLAAKTWECLSQGFHKIRSTHHLTTLARKIENAIDDISESQWMHIDVSVSAIYEKVEQSFTLQPIHEHLKLKAAISVRNHFHNLRILLLEQLLGARMLINSNDYGSEIERVWQQFFQRELGPEFRVLQGGHILSYEGDNANAQIDLIIVPADAHVMMASGSDGSKVNVLCDQVIAAVMTTSNLSVKKMAEDWEKLRRVSGLFKFTDELPHAFPTGKDQAWPLCYIISGQSDSLPSLAKEWMQLANAMPKSGFVPQFVISLDSGFVYSGATSWPRPRFPVSSKNTNQVTEESDIYAGLGLAWLLTQIRGRAKLLQHKPVSTIKRFAKLLDDAALKSATPPTWSHRFYTMFTMRPIEGVLHWGHTTQFAHNRLLLSSLQIHIPEPKAISNVFISDVDPAQITWNEEQKYLRWFRHGIHFSHNGITALQEWKKITGSAEYITSYAFFNSTTGVEIKLNEPLGNVNLDVVRSTLTSLGSATELNIGS